MPEGLRNEPKTEAGTGAATATATATTDWPSRPGPIGILTGAGISTASDIPAFRGVEGVWTKNPIAELSATIDDYLSDPDLRIRSWMARRDNPA